MAETPYTFTKDGARRIIKAVRKSEQSPQTPRQHLRTNLKAQPPTPWWGRIATIGPEEEVDFIDARYWVKRVKFNEVFNPITSEDELEFDNFIQYDSLVPEDMDMKLSWWVQVTNLTEVNSHLHELRKDDLVLVHTGQLETGELRYYINQPVKGFVYAEIRTSDPDGVSDDNKWVYSGVRVEITAGGTIREFDPPQPFDELYNLCEVNNLPDESIRGNSVDSDGETYRNSDFRLQPVRGNPIVVVYSSARRNESTGLIERVNFFQYENADDGEC